MSKERIVAGLDVGSSKVACVIAKKSELDLPEIIGKNLIPSFGKTFDSTEADLSPSRVVFLPR